MTEEVFPGGEPTIRVTATPADTNVYGDIFGGWLMAQMDLAASAVASRHSGGRAVTIAVDGMTFHRPVFVGRSVRDTHKSGSNVNGCGSRNMAPRPAFG